MLVRPITKEERLQSAQLFAIAFESPFDPNDLTPFAENPCIWAAFDEESGEMMSTVYVTDYRVQFDGGRYKMGGIGGVASLPQYRRAGGIRACFQKALPILYREGYVFSYLYPFSTAYYRKFGYESCVQRYLAVLDLRQLGGVVLAVQTVGIRPAVALDRASRARRSFPARSGLHEAAICCCPLSGSSMRGGKRSIT